jgi:outer membrane protein OmpA-like peptidoglycan-associated protein/opacity protein-like surface antigen
MKRWLTISVCLVLALASTAAATDRAGKVSLGLRGGGFAPMLDGSKFTLNGRSYEPFMMGGAAGVELGYGVSNKFELLASGLYTRTFDDTSATSDRSFSIAKRDNAVTRLNIIQLGLLGRYLFAPASRTQPYLAAGVGLDMTDYMDRATDKAMPSVTDIALKGGLGLTHAFSEVVSLDVRALFTYYVSTASTDTVNGSTYSVADWEKYDERPYKAYIQPTIGLTFSFGGAKDEDKDGVSDKKDECPMTPAGALVDERGCPMDTDGDGVFDGIDQCAGTPKGAKVDAMGCPKDSDGDGVFDGLDQCADTPAGAKVDASGCPLDGDKDGVPDYLDKQLDTPAGARVDADGVGIDSDSDGVYDGLDQCAGTPKDLEVDASGCPVKVAKLVGKITLNIKYASGSAEPDLASKHVLDSVVEILRAYPDTRIRISGFTDNLGSEEKNMALSQKRAEGVKAYLAAKGVDAERMLTQGMGENPQYFVGDNNTAEGRQANRRVELESTQ